MAIELLKPYLAFQPLSDNPDGTDDLAFDGDLDDEDEDDDDDNADAPEEEEAAPDFGGER